MSRVPIAGFMLRRLGSAFVDRDDRHDRHRTARTLHSLATRGSALGFFPEGTFDKSPGLKAVPSRRVQRGRAREAARRARRDPRRALEAAVRAVAAAPGAATRARLRRRAAAAVGSDGARR